MTDQIDNDIVDNSDDDDILKDLFMPDDDDKGNKGDALDSEEMKTLREELADKDKQINGLLQTVKSDRRKRQEMKGQLDQVTTTINSILSQREEMKKQLDSAESGASKTVNGIPIEFDDDGNAFVPNDKLESIIEPYQERIDLLEGQLQQTAQNTQAQAESQQLLQNILGEDERFPTAHSRYQKARAWANDRVIDFQRENNIQGPFTSGQALTYVFDDRMTQEFAQEFPGMDLGTVVTGDDSPYHLRQALRMTADSMAPKQEPDARFRQVVNKPSGLGKSANAKGGELSLTEKVAKLSATDIMKLDDAQLEALQKYMADEEKTEGINF